jgi:hypothetical protein
MTAITLDDLLAPGMRPLTPAKPAKAAKPPKPAAPPEPPPPSFEGYVWRWRRFTCSRCGTLHTAPAESIPFARWVYRGPSHRVELRPDHQGLHSPDTTIEWLDSTLPGCPCCLHTLPSGRQHPLSLPIPPGAASPLAIAESQFYHGLLYGRQALAALGPAPSTPAEATYYLDPDGSETAFEDYLAEQMPTALRGSLANYSPEE